MLKKLLGDKYKDDMTVEEIQEALKGMELVDKSTLPKSVDKATFDKTASDLAAANKKLKELESKSMTDEQKLEQALKGADDIKAQYAKELAKLRAEKVFTAAGLTEADYATVIDLVISEDAEVAETNARNMVALLNTQKEAVAQAKERELLNKTPKPTPGVTPDNKLTPDAIKGKTYEELVAEFQKDPTQFQS